jgi:hypothetical protein
VGRLRAVEHHDAAPPLGSERAAAGSIEQLAPAGRVPAHDGCWRDTPAAHLPGHGVRGRRVEHDEHRLTVVAARAGRDQAPQPRVRARDWMTTCGFCAMASMIART